MRSKVDRYPFTLPEIRHVPPTRGVYCLWNNEELVYVGSTPQAGSSIQAALTDHCFGKFGGCTQNATHFSFETCPGGELAREMELLSEFAGRSGRLPRCQKA